MSPNPISFNTSAAQEALFWETLQYRSSTRAVLGNPEGDSENKPWLRKKIVFQSENISLQEPILTRVLTYAQRSPPHLKRIKSNNKINKHLFPKPCFGNLFQSTQLLSRTVQGIWNITSFICTKGFKAPQPIVMYRIRNPCLKSGSAN